MGDLSLSGPRPTSALAPRPARAPSVRPMVPVAPAPPVSVQVPVRPGGALRPPSLAVVAVEMLRLRRTVRQQQTLGPLLLVLVGLLQPVTVVEMPGGVTLSRTLWVTVRYFAGRDGGATGPVSPAVAWGSGLATVGSVAILLGAVVLLCGWWNELRVVPARALTLTLRGAAIAMAAGAATLLAGQSLPGQDGMHGSAWQVGTLLFAAAGVWLVLGVTAPSTGSRRR